MVRIDYDLHNRIYINRRVPSDWARIATSPTPHKTRVTISVDSDVLRAFMHARLMGLLHGDETIDQFKEQDESGPRDRPEFGWTERALAENRARRGKE